MRCEVCLCGGVDVEHYRGLVMKVYDDVVVG